MGNLIFLLYFYLKTIYFYFKFFIKSNLSSIYIYNYSRKIIKKIFASQYFIFFKHETDLNIERKY